MKKHVEPQLTIPLPVGAHVENHMMDKSPCVDCVDDGRGCYHVIVGVVRQCEPVAHVRRVFRWNWRWRNMKRQTKYICNVT